MGYRNKLVDRWWRWGLAVRGWKVRTLRRHQYGKDNNFYVRIEEVATVL